MNRYVIAVQLWAEEKGLLYGDPSRQLLKVYEEVSETAQAYMRGQRENLVEEIGDILVTVIVFAEQVGINPEEALKVAYNKIKDRQGRMVDGTFVKEEDLSE